MCVAIVVQKDYILCLVVEHKSAAKLSKYKFKMRGGAASQANEDEGKFNKDHSISKKQAKERLINSQHSTNILAVYINIKVVDR